MSEKYDFTNIELKWQSKWDESKIFEVKVDPSKQKFYNLEMYPYPSGSMHIGHLRNYAIGDSFSRFKRMKGFNVLYPMGYDAFGLPAENAAIKHGEDPEEWTWRNINEIKAQQKRLGFSYDWTRQIQSITEDYYGHNQWMFIKMWEKGLAYQEEAYANWCPSCTTVLANEQVVNGRCWRCHNKVDQKLMRQWFFRIRNYADELLECEKDLNWPERVKTMQQNWIGRSEGTEIKFTIKDTGEEIPIFTTRADTLYGVTFMTFAPEHPLVHKWVQGTKYETDFKKFHDEVMHEDKFQRTNAESEKKGMFIGKFAINPINGEEVPVYVGNFVIYEYGAGAVMAVPAHDQRDFEFAKKFNIPIRVVIQPFDGWELDPEKMSSAYEQDGKIANSKEYDGLDNRQAIKDIGEKLKQMGKGGPVVNYKIRNWLISRQRYWGTPIPMVYCDKCGVLPVKYEDLPVKLPKNVKFTGTGNPLETDPDFVNTTCPKCQGPARRETDTMDTFVDSSWYFFRFTCPTAKGPVDWDQLKYWGPVDQYTGGIEHAIMHLLYARFFTKVMRDIGLQKFDEPFKSLLCQGMVNMDTPYCTKENRFLPVGEYDPETEMCKKCNQKYEKRSTMMSKSLGNTISPMEIINKYGADTTRFFILAVANPTKELTWGDLSKLMADIERSFKLLNRLWDFILAKPAATRKTKNIFDEHIEFLLHKTIKESSENLETMNLRDSITPLVIFLDYLQTYAGLSVNGPLFKKCKEILLLLFSPYTPHLCEELWARMGKKDFISLAAWPTWDPAKIDEKLERKWITLDTVEDDIRNIQKITGMGDVKNITLIVADDWKAKVLTTAFDLFNQGKNQGDAMKAVMQDATLRPKGKQVSSIVDRFYKNPGKHASPFSGQADEFAFIDATKEMLARKFNCPVVVEKEQESKNSKASMALPAKPAIILG